MRDHAEFDGSESELVTRLRAGDESAFAQLVDRYTPTMLRVARGYVSSHEVAEEVVQETWIALLKGINRFEGRSSVRTWLFTVLVNIAKTRGLREHNTAAAELAALFPHGATVDPTRFRPAGDQYPHGWVTAPGAWPVSPESSVLGREVLDVARRAMDTLPARQRMVVALRDMLGLDAEQVCRMLAISAENQRVLLHRGRARIRQGLEDYLEVGSR